MACAAVRRCVVSELLAPRRMVELEVDGEPVRVFDQMKMAAKRMAHTLRP